MNLPYHDYQPYLLHILRVWGQVFPDNVSCQKTTTGNLTRIKRISNIGYENNWRQIKTRDPCFLILCFSFHYPVRAFQARYWQKPWLLEIVKRMYSGCVYRCQEFLCIECSPVLIYYKLGIYPRDSAISNGVKSGWIRWFSSRHTCCFGCEAFVFDVW